MILGNDGGGCGLVQRRRSLVDDLQPADGRVLPRHRRQPDALPRLRRAAGQHDHVSVPSRVEPRRASRCASGTRSAAARAATSPCSRDDPNIVYAGSYQGYLTRYDHARGQLRNITVWPEDYMRLGRPSDFKYRFQWTSPIVFSPHDPERPVRGGNHVFRSTRRGPDWEADQPRPDAQRPGEAGAVRRADHQGQHRRRGLRHGLRARRVAARSAACSGPARDDGLVHVSPRRRRDLGERHAAGPARSGR